MLENRIRDNGQQYYKFATITVRVFVDKDEVEQAVEHGYQDPLDGEFKKYESESEAFEALAREKINEMFNNDDEPCKLYDISLS